MVKRIAANLARGYESARNEYSCARLGHKWETITPRARRCSRCGSSKA